MWYILMYYPSICLQGLRETTENLSQDNWSKNQDLNARSVHICLNTMENITFFKDEWSHGRLLTISYFLYT